MACEQTYTPLEKDSAPPFLSKWKIRKRKEQKDPLINVRKKTRRKSKELLRKGKIRKRPCLVCGTHEVVMHHESYDDPYRVLWLCDAHHKDYHDGKIGLLEDTLWWDSNRLIPQRYRGMAKPEKYAALDRMHSQEKASHCETGVPEEGAGPTSS